MPAFNIQHLMSPQIAHVGKYQHIFTEDEIKHQRVDNFPKPRRSIYTSSGCN